MNPLIVETFRSDKPSKHKNHRRVGIIHADCLQCFQQDYQLKPLRANLNALRGLHAGFLWGGGGGWASEWLRGLSLFPHSSQIQSDQTILEKRLNHPDCQTRADFRMKSGFSLLL